VTAHRFRTMLKKEFYVNSYVVSLDDFYIDQYLLPMLPDGSKDLETVYSLDVGCIHRCFEELTRFSRSSLPTFDFLTARRSAKTNDIVLGENDILIVEGIHALNPLITQGIDPTKFFRLYISVQGEYRCDGEVVLDHTKIRFIRRCVRDYTHRASSPENTAQMWTSVRDGEKRYISPYKRYADLTIDSLILYEPCILHQFINPMIERMDITGEYYPRFKKIHDVLERFAALDQRHIAADSLLREFID
ncbi:MAG: uridine kinase, partial [Acetanaerobacterium sp.]